MTYENGVENIFYEQVFNRYVKQGAAGDGWQDLVVSGHVEGILISLQMCFTQ